MSYLMDYGEDYPPASIEPSRTVRVYEWLAPGVNFGVHWISRTTLYLGLAWLLAIGAGWLR